MRLLTLRTILVASDLADSSDVAVLSGGALARVAEAALSVVHVVGSGVDAQSEDAVAEALRRAGVRREEAHVVVVPGAPVAGIRAAADRLAADVIVLGPHRKRDEGDDRALGSTAYGVVSGATVPCLVLAEPLRLPLTRVLVPIDLSETARGALMVAQSWASALRARAGSAELTVLHVASNDAAAGTAEAADRLEAELEILRRTGGNWAGVSVRAVTAAARDVAATITEHASDHDLLVVGTRGLGGHGSEAIGSVASALIRRVRAPLLLVPPAVRSAHTALQESSAGA